MRVDSNVSKRCVTCGGGFGLIRHRVAHRHFCSKHCLDKHLANREQEPLDLKQRIEFSRA